MGLSHQDFPFYVDVMVGSSLPGRIQDCPLFKILGPTWLLVKGVAETCGDTLMGILYGIVSIIIAHILHCSLIMHLDMDIY